MKYYILYICVVIISAVTRTCSTFSSNEFEIPPAISSPIVDTLSHVYDSAHSAAVDLRLTDFVDLADTGFWNRLEVLSRRYGFNSVQSYLGQQAFYWPDIDTLVITEIRESGDYARLTGMGAGRQSWQYPARIHYTFILFHHTEDGWMLAGLTNLAKNQRDSYGYAVTYSEMELPPELRFPREF
jgi:hypothetical protein